VLFPTVAFALFFCVAFLANWLLRPRPTAWRVAMIGLSFFFYGYWDARFVALLAASIVINHVAALMITGSAAGSNGRRQRIALAVGVGVNLGILGFFKYYGFFVTSVANGLGRLGIETSPPLLDIVLPIGISFFTFQAISYLVDLSRGKLDGPLPLLNLGFYLSFFPQLVAGPIVRATDLAPQIDRRPDPRTIPAGEAFWLIAQGLLKKVVISSYLATNLVDPVFDVPGEHSRLDVLLAIYGYSVQIYADFSGYTDIAIGCALLLGFRFPKNFDSPFRALSIQDFWRRWHISLSTWLRDYVYIPLGGNRGGRVRTARNLALTMVLGGLWHGAAWTFLVWGAIHGAALIAERLVAGPLRRRRADQASHLPQKVSTGLRWFVTVNVVGLSWVFFRADSVERALELLERLVVGGEPSKLVSGLAIAVVVGAIGAQMVPQLVDRLRLELGRAAPAAQALTLALALTAIDAFGPDGVAPFIYFQF
jgi:D-alanyl-lipoteichoic acid acyltransferase DltB (MBOAT superfamily)